MATSEHTANVEQGQVSTLPGPWIIAGLSDWTIRLPDAAIPFDSTQGKESRPLKLSTGVADCLVVRRIQRAPDGTVLILGEIALNDEDSLPVLLILREDAARVQWLALGTRHRETLKRSVRLPRWMNGRERQAAEYTLMACAEAHDKKALEALADEILSGVRRPSGRKRRSEGERWLARQLATVKGDVSAA